jgi:hypothetical protein
VNLVGTWNLEVATPFGKHPATLTFEAAGGALSGKINSRLGISPLEGLTTQNDGFEATVSLEFQGKPYAASITGQVAENSIDGTIKVKLPIAPPIRYTGTRAG